MVVFWTLVLGSARSIWDVASDRDFRPLFGLVMTLIAGGTLFYWGVEGWPPLDAAYFSVVTLATVGYGDYAPETRIGKIFTMVYVMVGVGVLGVFVNTIARRAARRDAHLRHFLHLEDERDGKKADASSPLDKPRSGP